MIGGYALALWLLAMFVAVRPVASRLLVPILVLAYLAPFVATPDTVGRFLVAAATPGARASDGPGADGREVKDVTPHDDDPACRGCEPTSAGDCAPTSRT